MIGSSFCVYKFIFNSMLLNLLAKLVLALTFTVHLRYSQHFVVGLVLNVLFPRFYFSCLVVNVA